MYIYIYTYIYIYIYIYIFVFLFDLFPISRHVKPGPSPMLSCAGALGGADGRGHIGLTVIGKGGPDLLLSVSFYVRFLNRVSSPRG
jgi:hypothetical protein